MSSRTGLKGWAEAKAQRKHSGQQVVQLSQRTRRPQTTHEGQKNKRSVNTMSGLNGSRGEVFVSLGWRSREKSQQSWSLVKLRRTREDLIAEPVNRISCGI